MTKRHNLGWQILLSYTCVKGIIIVIINFTFIDVKTNARGIGKF